MERRLKVAKQLLNPLDSVLSVIDENVEGTPLSFATYEIETLKP